MKEIQLFHYLSHARWLFLVWTVVLVIQAFADPSRYALANTSLAVFLAGLALGFWGFSDIEKTTRQERKDFDRPAWFKRYQILFLVMAGFSFLIGLYMMNIKAFRPDMHGEVAVELKTVGYHSLALGFGFLCYLKMMLDKHKHYQSLPKVPPAGDPGEVPEHPA